MQHFETTKRPTHEDSSTTCTSGSITTTGAGNNNNNNVIIVKKGRSKGETIAGILGSVMEWYDFAVFGYFSDIIAKVFFPPQEGHKALLQSFCIFGSAYVMRPIGGVMFGKFGDMYGRKVVLELSILLMAGATFTLGCLPSYNAIGWPAIVLLLLTRLVQGASVGGQLMTSLIFTLEGKPKNTWGFYGAIVMSTVSSGVLVGSLVGYSIRSSLTQTELEFWGWRLPFLAGLVLGLPGMYLKWHTGESDIDRKIRESNIVDNSSAANMKSPLEVALSKKHRRALISASLVPMVQSGGFYLTFVWLVIYMKTLLHPPIPQAFLINSMVIALTSVVYVLIGRASDRSNYKRTNMMFIGGICLAIFSPIMVMIIGKGQALPAFLAQLSIGVFYALWSAPMNAWLVESFPPQVRLTALSIAFNFAQATVGGFTPAFATLLVDHYGKNSPGFMMTILACISMCGLLAAPDHKDYAEDDDEVMSSSSAIVPLKHSSISKEQIYDDCEERRELVTYRQVV